MEKICYLIDAQQGHEVPPGFCIRELSETERPAWWARWLGKAKSRPRIVYLERCRLSWDDLELVSFVPNGSSRGALCWCELHVQLADPEQLLGQLGTEDAHGQWAVTREALEKVLRPHMVAALEAIGARGDWGNEAYWPQAAADIAARLDSSCPAGIVLDRSQPDRPPCVIRRVRSFEQCIEERKALQEFDVEMQKVIAEGRLVEAIWKGSVDELLACMGEDRLRCLLTPKEQAAPPEQRLSSYIVLTRSGDKLWEKVVIGNYQFIAKLGRGGMGEVWKAWDTKGERPVVLKLVPPDLRHAKQEMDRLRATFRLVHALQHQHICPVYSLDEDPRFGWYVVMKYIEGQTLSAYRATYVARHGSFPLEQVVKVLRPVAEALDYAHQNNVIHRDVKPENILVQGDAKDVQLIDFGLAAEIRTSLSRVSQVRMETSGTRPYMAPEQWRAESQDAKTDQYALAVVAYELIAGHLPFESPDFDVLRASVLNDPPRRIKAQPEWVNPALMRGLAKRREERFDNCTAFIKALEPRQPTPSPPPSSLVVTEWIHIPAGPYQAGSDRDKMVALLEQMGILNDHNLKQLIQEHETKVLGEYWIMRYPVTNEMYQVFVQSTFAPAPPHWPIPRTEKKHPVVNITWQNAMAFADWMGCDLPTIAEWEKAARGSNSRRCYPWGDQFDATRCVCDEAGATGTAEVGSHPGGDSPYGVGDMVGNVWEWVKDSRGNNYFACKGGSFGCTCQIYGLIHFTAWVQDGFAKKDRGFRLVSRCDPRHLQSPGVQHEVVK